MGRAYSRTKSGCSRKRLSRHSKRSASRIPWDRILILADNYGSHHAKLTQQRADELDTEFFFIPPYSLALNTIEPL
ncbi:transposase [Natronosalvus hydrolyticus]|uniref:transposase n=1 Tax=Natronosalvus hydrolyticus TaxID=2979988 RepID=UPI003CCC60D0